MRSEKVKKEIAYQRELASLAPLFIPAGEKRKEREIPDSLDRKRADALLRKLTASQMREVSVLGLPEFALKQIRLGQVQFDVVPHKYLNMIRNHFGYHWNGVDYV